MRWVALIVVMACQYDTPQVSEVRACPPGQFATDVSGTGFVSCTEVDIAIGSAIGDHCSTFLGWRDSCGGCTTVPEKLGSIGKSCDVGVGAGNTCTVQNLAGTQTSLFGLDLDGEVNDDDKLYGSLHCSAPAPLAGLAPCEPGQVVVGFIDSSWTCASLGEAVVDYVSGNCSLYLGWQDTCDGCVNPPAKWGHAGDVTCENGAGDDNTCSTATIGGQTVNLFGLNTDGVANEDDKFHVGLDCIAPAPATTNSTTTCAPGQFVTGTLIEGGFRCESIAPLVADYFGANCTLTFGWQDFCDGCMTPPSKFGNVRVGGCTLGAGADNTCGTFTLGAASVDMFGLNTDGAVDGNDALAIGFRCQ